MPSVSIMLEGLVTTLLSLDYIHQKHEAPLPYQHSNNNKHQSSSHSHLSPLVGVPFRCRSNSLSSSASDESDNSSTASSSTGSGSKNGPEYPAYEYHCPPIMSNNDNDNDSDANKNYYADNDTVFGAILRGELPAITLSESTRLLAIQDIKPRAPLHALVIPKAFIGSVFDLKASDAWLQELKTMAVELVRTHHPEAFQTGDYRLCFHIPPFNSVDHLHLHVLAPVSEMGFYYKFIKYNPRMRWCIGLEAVLQRLEEGLSPVPYRRPPTSRPQRQEMSIMVEEEGEEQQGQECLLEEIQNNNNNQDSNQC